MKKAIAITLALLLALSVLAACGKGGSKSGKSGETTTAAPTVPGETKSWGKLSVLVPDGFSFEKGTMTDDADENGLRLTKTNDTFPNFYLYFTVMGLEEAQNNVDTTREWNQDSHDVQDVADYQTGDNTWTGVCYSNETGTWTCYAIYTMLDDGNVIYAMICSKDMDVTNAVLASVDLAA